MTKKELAVAERSNHRTGAWKSVNELYGQTPIFVSAKAIRFVEEKHKVEWERLEVGKKATAIATQFALEEKVEYVVKKLEVVGAAAKVEYVGQRVNVVGSNGQRVKVRVV